MIRLHHHEEEGVTGLAAFCDTCGEMITKNTAPGYVVWQCDPDGTVTAWKLIHQSTCDPGEMDRAGWPMSMPFDVEILYLANCSGIDLAKALETLEELC